MMIPTMGVILLIMGLARFSTMVYGFLSVLLALVIFYLRRIECAVRIYSRVTSFFVSEHEAIPN